MRREGFELAVGKPKVIYKEVSGERYEPLENLVVDVPRDCLGPVMQLAGDRRGELLKMDTRGNLAHMEFIIPARGLIGMRSRMLNATQGEAIMHHTFARYDKARGSIPRRANGVMIALESGQVTAYALDQLSDRGMMFVVPGDRVYEGQVVGEHCKDDDICVNVVRQKKLTNMRASTKDFTVILKAAREMSLEAALEYIENDELVELTPQSIRLRKRYLQESERRRNSRRLAAAEAEV
jgi:GTP-binding protein